MLAIVLSRRDWREYDQIITLYTKERGKLELLGRGIKKITAKNAAALEPLCLSTVGMAPGKENKILTTAEAANCFPDLKNDFDKVRIGLVAAKFYERLTEKDEPDEALFDLLGGFLKWLNKSTPASPLILPAFILKFFAGLGFSPELSRCVGCGKKVAEDKIKVFDKASGGLRHEACLTRDTVSFLPASVNVVKVLRVLLRGEWSFINKLRLAKIDEVSVSKIVHKFVEFHSQGRVPNW